MAVKIRLMRVGKKKQPTYRVVVADGRSPRDGRFIEIIGQYAPREDPSRVSIDADSALAWLRKGAQPTEQVQKLLTTTGVWAQYEAERKKPAVTKLSRRGYMTGKVAPGVKAAQGSAGCPQRRSARCRRACRRAPVAEAAAVGATPRSRRPWPRLAAEDAAAEEAAAERSRGAPRPMSDEDPNYVDPNLIADDDFDDDDDDDDDFVDEIGADGNRVVGARAVAVAEHVTRSLAEDPDAIDIVVEERRDDEVALLVHANPDDMGRLIGRRGRVIQALRQLVRAAGSADGVKAKIDIVE